MDKLDLIPHIKKIYDDGDNIIQFLKNRDNRDFNTIEDILISYDFQAGSYIEFVTKNPQYIEAYTKEIAKVLSDCGEFHSLLEAGVGEATTLGNLILAINNEHLKSFGFDISWSRVHYGQKYLKQINQKATLFVADLFNIPLPDSSIDIVYTSHSIEPNGQREKEAIAELYRITKKYLILLEPTAEFANEEGQLRMKNNGYVHHLKDTINELGYHLCEYKAFPVTSNPLNPTGLYVIEKKSKEEKNPDFICPISKSILQEYDDHFFSSSSLISYPKIISTPMLCTFNGILTSKHE